MLYLSGLSMTVEGVVVGCVTVVPIDEYRGEEVIVYGWIRRKSSVRGLSSFLFQSW